MKNPMNMAVNTPKPLAWAIRCAFLPPVLAACLGATGIGSAIANPSNPTVVNGQVTFSQNGNVYTITNSPSAIINWNSFSINAGELVRFIQQNSSSSVLNRITGQDPSQIMGALESNGRVFLINPNGIMFGAGAQINVAGLVASTLAISDSNFLAGKNKFAAGDVAGAVNNMGAITTPSGGQVYLIAPDVTNSGIITSPKGEVVLAAGRSVQLADSSNPDMQVVVSAPSDRALNLGDVIAQGGKIGIYAALINQRGKLNANSAVLGEDGKIVLKASRDTLLEAGSVTSATGVGQGGEVQVLGQRVALTGDARIDASGQTGGGTVLVGGDYQGKNAAVQNAEQVFVGKDAVIKADAIASGNGGKVIVWGNQTAQVYGSIFARGGAAWGNGGFIETSGLQHLDVAGIRVNAGAPKGKNGQWLLDPENIIVNDGPVPLSDVAAFGSRPGETTEINAQLLSNATADVILQATNDITFYYGVNNTHGVNLTAQAGNDIIVSSNVNFSGNITLAANHNGAGTATGTGRVRFDDGQAIAGGIRTITDSLNPPAVVPPVTQPPSTDICTIAPNSALCQVLSPPTASEPVKPVQQASNEIIKTVTQSAPKTDFDQLAFLDTKKQGDGSSGGSGSSGSSGTSTPDDKKSDDNKPDDKKADTKEVASNDKSGTKNEPTKKMYCN